MSAPIPILYRGANLLVTLALTLENGVTPLLVSTLARAEVQLYSGATLVDTFIMGTDDELRAGAETDELELELTTALVNSLTVGKPLTIRRLLQVADADFTVEPGAFSSVRVITIAQNVL